MKTEKIIKKMEIKKMKKTKKGFTLVEIMIVVAIIGLLAAIGIPSFQRARANSIAKAKENNVRIISGAIEEWAMETAAVDGAAVDAVAVEDYIKGGYTALDVGAGETVTAAEITATTVGQDLTVADFYTP
jgi:type IV pilus assembly protein PilA